MQTGWDQWASLLLFFEVCSVSLSSPGGMAVLPGDDAIVGIESNSFLDFLLK